MSSINDMMKDYVARYAEEHEEYRLTRVLLPRKSFYGKWMKPFTMGYKHVIHLPGDFRPPIVRWFAPEEYTLVKLQEQNNGAT